MSRVGKRLINIPKDVGKITNELIEIKENLEHLNKKLIQHGNC